MNDIKQELVKLSHELKGFRIQSPTQERIHNCFKCIEIILKDLYKIKDPICEKSSLDDLIENLPQVEMHIPKFEKVNVKDPRENSKLKPSNIEDIK